MIHRRFKFAARAIVLLAAVLLVPACALLSSDSRTNYFSMHMLMHDLNDANMKSMSQEFGEARKGAARVGELTAVLQTERFHKDDQQFLDFANDLEGANAQLQAALEKPVKFKQLEAAVAEQVRTCNECHAVYR